MPTKSSIEWKKWLVLGIWVFGLVASIFLAFVSERIVFLFAAFGYLLVIMFIVKTWDRWFSA